MKKVSFKALSLSDYQGLNKHEKKMVLGGAIGAQYPCDYEGRCENSDRCSSRCNICYNPSMWYNEDFILRCFD